jgi:hypothetical protein
MTELETSREVIASVGNLGAGERGAVPGALRDYLGKRLPLKVIEADHRRDRLDLSEKAAAHQRRRRRKEEASSQLVEGQVLDGTVASVTTFGRTDDSLSPRRERACARHGCRQRSGSHLLIY